MKWLNQPKLGAKEREQQFKARILGKQLTPEEEQTELQKLTDKVDQLQNLTIALWSLIQDKTDLTEADLKQKLAELAQEKQRKSDRTPTVLRETKPKKTAQDCPQCGRPLQKLENRFHKCLYCGYTQDFDSVFDTIA